ncbi:MAG: ABC transporter permease subunit, partial [Pedosphaera parvula]|nr:ABC transporter permease subunit [Pedosphaera parvula]
MTFLPIVERELRVAARRKATYRVRFRAVVVAMAVFGWLIAVMLGHTPETYHGRLLFIGMGIVAFIHCLLSGAFVAADCLAGEKRDGTLGLLFLTDLKGYDVIFGKLAASSLNSFYGLLAFLPLMGIPLQLGGITGADLWRTALLLLNTLFFSVAAGMFVSVISRDERKALFGALLLVLGVCFAPWLATVWVMDWLSEVRLSFEDVCLVMSPSPLFPGGILIESIATGRTSLPAYAFTVSMTVIHAMSWFLLVLAARILPEIWKDPNCAPLADQTRSRVEQLSYGKLAPRREHRRRLLDRNPFLWLTARDRWKPAYVWGFLGAMIVIFLLAWWHYQRIMLDEAVVGWFVMLTQTALKVWIAGEACFQLALDRRAGTLELLLSTPLTPREIVRGQWLALRRQFAVPILILFALELLILPKSLGWPLTIVNQLVFVADAFALGWAGMWFGLTARSTSQALTKTVLLLLALPWGLTLGGELLWDLFRSPYPFHASSRDVVIIFWLVSGLAVDLVVGFLWARSRLASRFRIVATQD